MPGLAENGPAGVHFRARERAGIAIADLRLVRDHNGQHEVLVEFMAAGKAQDAAEAALCSWARNTGYRRVWLPDGPVESSPRGRSPPPPLRAPRAARRGATRRRVLGASGTQRLLPHDLPHLRTHLPQWDVSDEA